MGNSLRCCLACVLPCGALDLIRIVHLNGHVEELTRPVTAGEFLREFPSHVLSKPCSQGVELPRILILSPDSELKKGGIYFLVPDPSVSAGRKSQANSSLKKTASKIGKGSIASPAADKLISEEVALVVPEKKSAKSSRRNRRSSRGQANSSWLPHLESIRED